MRESPMNGIGKSLITMVLVMTLPACSGDARDGEGRPDQAEGGEVTQSAPPADPSGTGEPAAEVPPGDRFLGEFRYMADAALFRPCDSERGMPVTGPAYLELERTYLEVRPGPGEPVLAELEGYMVEQPRMEGEGTERALAVTRVIGLDPSRSCATASPS
jgi:hypothetical protein